MSEEGVERVWFMTGASTETQAGMQAGDPVKAVAAILAAVEATEPAKRLVPGKRAFDRMQARLEVWKHDLAAWQETSLGVDFAAEKTQ